MIGPYPWVKFPSEETPLKRKFREAVIIDPKYIENNEQIKDEELIGNQLTGVTTRYSFGSFVYHLF